ncbi:MAG: hypothetical protein ACTTJC_05785 [Campylobacter sp.]
MQIKDKFLNANLQNISNKVAKNDKFYSFKENLASTDEQNSKIYSEFENQMRENDKIFKKFDFQQMMTKLEFGNLKDSKREEIIAKMIKLAKEF